MSTKVEEITKMMEGLSIKDLAKIAKQLETGTLDDSAPTTRKTISAPTRWELALCNYPDFAIKRITPKTEQLLVIMPSCAGYYIKQKKNGQEIIENFNEDLFVKFTAGMGEIIIKDENMWISKIEGGKKFWSYLTKALKNATYITMVKKHCAPKFDDVFKDRWNSSAKTYTNCYEAYPNLYEQYAKEPRIIKNFLMNKDITIKLIESFGLDNVRDFIEEFKLSLIQDEHCNRSGYSYQSNPFNCYSLTSLLKDNIFEYKRFKDYVLYQSVRMGYACSMDNFWQAWKDTLEMQKQMYGKIKEKYPDDLPLYHQQLSYKAIINREIIDAACLKRTVEKLSKYDMTIGDFIFMCPKSQQDMSDEAQQQANCLASYIKKYINGESEIFFMRKKDEPETSYITIEKNDYDLRQIYYACNRHVSDEDRKVAEEWLKRCEKIDKKESAA